MKLCAVIPVYNHGQTVGAVIDALRGHNLPILLVDNGSDSECAEILDRLAMSEDITLLRNNKNYGKGGAMILGLFHAARLGYSHALQIDSDGQYDVADIPLLIGAAHDNPEAVVTGYPIYEKSVAKSRYYARYATHIWVWINTLSLRIKDAMCGFRIYPLKKTTALLREKDIGQRMDFDVEILVQLDWKGIKIINVPIHVCYPLDGISHFRAWQDNVLISYMHTRLFFGMLWRSPKLAWRLLESKTKTVV